MDTNEDDEHDDGERDGGEDRDDDDNGNMKATKAVTKVDLTNEMGADGLSEVVPSSRSLPPSLKVAPNVAQAIPMMKEQSNKSKGKGKGKSTGTERVSPAWEPTGCPVEMRLCKAECARLPGGPQMLAKLSVRRTQ